MFLLGIATVALASCTNEEVVEMPQNRAIGFSTFVNNSTRALTELTDAENSFTKFYVFGSYGSASTWTSVFTNTEVKGGKVDGTSKWTPTNAAYWEPSQSYLFAAYSNGNGSTTADFDEVTNTLWNFYGDSLLVNPNGEVEDCLGDREELLIANLDKKYLKEIKECWKFR